MNVQIETKTYKIETIHARNPLNYVTKLKETQKNVLFLQETPHITPTNETDQTYHPYNRNTFMLTVRRTDGTPLHIGIRTCKQPDKPHPSGLERIHLDLDRERVVSF